LDLPYPCDRVVDRLLVVMPLVTNSDAIVSDRKGGV
jgi:hypothetical protein